jgi:hypothetical protein
LADSILGHWAELLSVLGRIDKLKALVEGTKERTIEDGNIRMKFEAAKEALFTMSAYPGIAYRCGTFALKEVGQKLRPGDRNIDNLIDVSSPPTGFSMSRLVELAREHDLDLLPV